MKKSISLLALSLCFSFIAMNLNAQNVNVNPGAGSYPTLKAAFDAINAGTHTGAITVNIILSTTEPVMATLNASGVGAANYTSVIIAPSGGARTVTGSDTATIKLAGADNVTINGTIGGVGRNLTVANTSILTGGTAIWLAHGGFAATDSAGARKNIVRNCEIRCGVTQNTATTTTNGVLLSGTTRTANGRNNDSNQVLENRIIRCRFGINFIGGTAANLNDNNTIARNIIGPTSFGADQIGKDGIFITFQNFCDISQNEVQFVGGNLANTTGGADRVGIAVGSDSWTSTTTTTTTGTNHTVNANKIHDIVEERNFSAVGLFVATTASGPPTNNLISNNAIYNIRSNGTGTDQCIGLGHVGNRGDRIVFNSILISDDMDPPGTGSASTNPLVVGLSKHLASAGDTAVLIKNNSIFIDATSNVPNLLKLCIQTPAAYAWGSGGLNNNNYFFRDTTNSKRTGATGTGTSPVFITLADWQTAYSPPQDGASIQCDPLYGIALKPQPGSCLVGAGVPIAGVTTDIEKAARSATTPTIGAYENTAVPPTDVGVVGAIVGANGKIISVGKGQDIVATVKNFGPLVTTVPVFYTVNGGSPVGPVNTVGPIPTNGTENVTFSGANAFIPVAAGIHTIRVFTALAGDTIRTNDTFTVVINVLQKITAFPYIQTFTNPFDWTILTENAVGSVGIWKLGIVTNPAGKVPDTAALANFFSASTGRREVLRSPEMDISSLSKPILHFYVAYRTFSTENDTLEVVLSTNGGLTFFAATTVYNKTNASVPSLATRPASSTSFFPDSARQWRHETINLANVTGSTNLVIGFRGKSAFGNNAWIDNVIVTNTDAYCESVVTAAGPYSCNSLLSVNFNTIGLRPVGNTDNNNTAEKDSKSNDAGEKILDFFPGLQNSDELGGNNQNNDGNQIGNNTSNDNPTGGVLSVTTHLTEDPPSLASPEIAPNTTATNPSGGISQPNVVYQDYWFTVTYTGNDRLGYANYNISIDVTTFTETDSLYILKRADMTASWVALPTTIVGTMAVSTGLTTFSDFALGGDSISQPLPVELSSFTSTVNRRDVNLNWTTASEVNNSGFDVERSQINGQWTKVGNVTGNGNTTTPHSYSFTDRGLSSGKYNYRLKQIDYNGNFAYYNLDIEVNVGVPNKFDLSQNYPNPFNPSTRINYDLPFDGKVSIKIFDISGREITSLINEVQPAGYYTINFNGSNLSSGVYFYRISADANGQNFIATKKMTIVK